MFSSSLLLTLKFRARKAKSDFYLDLGWDRHKREQRRDVQFKGRLLFHKGAVIRAFNESHSERLLLFKVSDWNPKPTSKFYLRTFFADARTESSSRKNGYRNQYRNWRVNKKLLLSNSIQDCSRHSLSFVKILQKFSTRSFQNYKMLIFHHPVILSLKASILFSFFLALP